MSPSRMLAAAFALLVSAAPAAAQMDGAAKKPLDHDAYDIWNRISTSALSANGAWALYGITSEANDPAVTVTTLDGATSYTLERAESPSFDASSAFVAYTIKPAKAAVEEARREDTPANRMPPDTLGILDLRTGAITRVARLRNFEMPEDAGGWIAYQLSREPSGEQGDSAAAPGAAARRPQ